jgi:hypothetical protein
MIERGYKTYLGISLVYLLAVVYLIINWNNPCFQDKLWPYALFSFLAIILFAILGLLFIVLRQFKAIGRSVFYKYLGLLNLFFGICELIIMIRLLNFEMCIICLPLLLIGIVILVDSNKAVY